MIENVQIDTRVYDLNISQYYIAFKGKSNIAMNFLGLLMRSYMENTKIKILAIDDNWDDLITLKALILDKFPEVVVLIAQSSIQGLELAASENPDVIFLDSIMPEMDGWVVCLKLKDNPHLCDIPVVFLTDFKSDKESCNKALDSGAEAFLAKPFDEIELIVQIRATMKMQFLNKRNCDENELLATLVEEKIRELKDSNKKTLRLLDTVKNDQAFIEAIFDSIPGYLYVYDESGKLIRWNKKHETMTGYSAEELSHITMPEWYDQEDMIKVNAAIHDVFEKGYGEVEAQLILKSGEKMFVRSSGAPLVWNGKKYFTGIGMDIGERKIVEKKLQQNMYDLLESQRISHVGTWRINFNTNEVIWSDEMYKIYDFDIKLPPPTYNESMKLFTPESWGKLSSSIEDTKISEIPYELELEIVTFNKIHGWIWARGGVVKDLKGNVTGLRGTAQDVTDRKIIEIQLQQNMDDLLESQRISHVGTWRMELATNEVIWSDELYKIYEFDPKLTPTPYNESMKLFTPESWEKLSTSIEHTRLSGIPYELELETVSLNGNHGWIWASGEVVKDLKGNVTGIRGAAQDITKRKKTENELLYLSYHDHLTNLYNRRFFEEELERLNTEENLPLSIIMCDVNGLKLVNDSFGHISGDSLLKKAAKTIKKGCREKDIISRVGGDEFVVILPRTTADESEQIANHMKELASKEKAANIELSISYGHDTKTTENQSIIDVVANAENDMYRHKLYERSSLRSKTIDLIMNALFEKSNREAKHSSRVSLICQNVAKKMNFSQDAVNQMRIAGLIHDIGKIGVDEKILNKPGRLTPEERSDIEKHPEIGWKILRSTNEFSELAQFVLNHHENWDGSGYPNGIKGEEIPIEARIIGVADSYDAMTSKRSYKKGMSHDDAIKELKRCSGTQFDPKVVDAFVKMAIPKIKDSNHVESISLK